MIDLTASPRPAQSSRPPRKLASGSSRSNSNRHAYRIDPQALQPRRKNRPAATTTAPGVSVYGYRFYVPLLGRWINRDPIIEAGSRNVYDFTFNTAINTIDYLGLDGKANCESVKTRALAWDFVKNLMKTPIQKLLEKGYSRENAKDLTQGGNNACLTGIECVESDSGVGGMYFHDTGTIKLNCCVGGKSRTSEEISQSLQHELSHAESMCRKPLADCDACMKEEMKAYWRAGECTSTAECAERAINSCKFGRRPHCGNKSVGQLLSNAAAGQYNPDQPYLPIPRNS